MRVIVALAAGWLGVAAAQQIEKPADEPAPKPVLQNTGKPMVLDCHCDETDIQSAGLSCTIEDPCPVFLELAWVETVGNRIFLAGNIHSATATLYSVMLASDDAGKTWREPYDRIRAAGFDRIQFIDFENGWVSGETQQPLPRDPFLLITSDGGKSWRARPVFADPQFGSIMQFSFSSRTDGSLVIDRGRTGESGRYELFETPDAGETWMLRQTNERPIQIKRAAAAQNGDWRIHADGATKSFRIEHRAGNTWRHVAAFAISIGVCKPGEVPPPAPVAAEPVGSARHRVRQTPSTVARRSSLPQPTTRPRTA
jgi:hypothetical protein